MRSAAFCSAELNGKCASATAVPPPAEECRTIQTNATPSNATSTTPIRNAGIRLGDSLPNCSVSSIFDPYGVPEKFLAAQSQAGNQRPGKAGIDHAILHRAHFVRH